MLYFSIHRYEHGEFWPNLREGDYDHVGEGKGRGYNINVPINQVLCLSYELLSRQWAGLEHQCANQTSLIYELLS